MNLKVWWMNVGKLWWDACVKLLGSGWAYIQLQDTASHVKAKSLPGLFGEQQYIAKNQFVHVYICRCTRQCWTSNTVALMSGFLDVQLTFKQYLKIVEWVELRLYSDFHRSCFWQAVIFIPSYGLIRFLFLHFTFIDFLSWVKLTQLQNCACHLSFMFCVSPLVYFQQKHV